MEWLLISMYVTVIFMVTYVITKVCQRFRQRHYDVPARDVRKGHRWTMTNMFPRPTYCNVSQNLIIQGAFCDSCGICVEDQSIKQANNVLPCKALATNSALHKHHWVQGNLPLCSKCYVCEEECGNLPQLCDFRCCWCNRTVHEHCASEIQPTCDLGQYSSLIIPPNCVSLKKVGLKGRRHLVVESVRRPMIEGWSPLIVVANRKSGNGDGLHVLQAFCQMLNPAQVIDLCDIPPECGLEWCHLLPGTKCRVLVAGGDGTIGWVLSAIDKLKLDPVPEVCLVPLGTGNDLSQVLGWGEGKTGAVDVSEVLTELTAATPVQLDRWKVQVTPAVHFGIRLPRKTMVMNNYCSIGVDALVTLNFHKHRESRPALFGSRVVNKFWYFIYGTKDTLERECKHLEKKVKVELDGKPVTLPEIEGIVVLNIASWGGGCRPWAIGGKDCPESRYDDGLMEVFALYSSFHIAQMQVGLAEPLRLGQAKKVMIKLERGSAPMQVDGEPWEQKAATIMITHHNQATLLANLST